MNEITIRLVSELTTMQMRVFALCVDGLTNYEIGNALGISHRTVMKHLNRVYRISGMGERRELLSFVHSHVDLLVTLRRNVDAFKRLAKPAKT